MSASRVPAPDRRHASRPTVDGPARSGRRREDDAVAVSLAVRTAAAWAWRLVAIGVAVYFVVRGLTFFAESVLIPMLIALLLTALLQTLVDAGHRLGVPRIVATFGAILALIGVLAGLGTLVANRVVDGLPRLSRQVNAGIQQVEDWVAEGPLSLSSTQLSAVTDQLRTQVQENVATIASSLATVATTATSLVTGLFVVLFLLIFFLYDGARIWAWCVHLLPRATVAPVDGAAHRGWLTLVHYVRATVVVAFTDSVLIGIGMAILGVPLAVPLAVVVFLGAFVPIVGALVSGSIAVLVAVVTVGVGKAAILLLVVLAVQQFEGHVLQPLLLGRAVSVHPVAVIIAIAGGIALAGLPGALFAVPLVAVTNTVVTYLVRGGEGGELPGEERANEGTAPLEPDVVPEDGEDGQGPTDAAASQEEPGGPEGGTGPAGATGLVEEPAGESGRAAPVSR